MVKTTISIPAGPHSEPGMCTIELPTEGFKKAVNDEENDKQLFAFISKISAFVRKTAGETIAWKKAAKRALEEVEGDQQPPQAIKKQRLDNGNHIVIPNDRSLDGMPVDGGKINLIFMTWDRQTVTIRTPRKTLMENIMIAWANHTGMQLSRVRFFFDGENIRVSMRAKSTPEEFDMQDGDTIDVHLEQVGS